MNHFPNRKRYTLGIINASDLLKGIRGGSTGFISSILPYLNAQKVIIFGVSRNDAAPWKPSYIHENVEFVPICKMKHPSKIPMRFKALLNYIRHRKKILNSGVDILYIHMPECCLPFLYGNKYIPVIYQQHGSGNPVALSKFFYARSIFFRGLFELILRAIYKHADWIIAIDKLCLAKAIKNGALRKTTLLMNAIDIGEFRPNETYRMNTRRHFGIKPNQYTILFVGRIAKTKGPARLLECIPFLKTAELHFHIFFAGEGSHMSYITDYVDKNRYSDRVTFLRHVPHEDLPLYYNMADVLVLPSDMEGVPMVVLESLACGTPVVASSVGGLPDIIEQGKNGILVESLSPGSLTRAIIQVLNMSNDREMISSTVDTFSSTNFVISLSKIIEGVLTKRNRVIN